MRHIWSLKTKAGWDKCGRCGLIRRTYGVGKRSTHSYHLGNKDVSQGPLMNKAPACKES